MSNLIKFPARPRPQQSDPPCDELMVLELEIEIARARLAQIRSETRYANAVLISYCVRKAAFWAVVLWVLSVLFGANK